MYQINFALCLCYNPHHHHHHLHQHYHCAVIIIIVFFFFIILQSICLPTCPYICVILSIHWLICLCTTLYKIGAKKARKREKSQFSILFFFKGTSGQALQRKNPSWTCNFPFPVALLPPTINQVKMIIKHQSSILMSMKQRRRNMQLMKI